MLFLILSIKKYSSKKRKDFRPESPNPAFNNKIYQLIDFLYNYFSILVNRIQSHQMSTLENKLDTQLSGALGTQNAIHLLNRVSFGASPAEISRFSGLTASQAVEELFRGLDTAVEPPIDPSTGETWLDSVTEVDGDTERDRQRLVIYWFLKLLSAGGVPTEDKAAFSFQQNLAFFFHTHFTTKISKVDYSYFIYYQIRLFQFFTRDERELERPEAPVNPGVGASTEEIQAYENDLAAYQEEIATIDENEASINYKTLCKKICLDNAMVRFLDGDQNVEGRINENFGREFLELYTIGKGLENDPSRPETEINDYFFFTEQDVLSAAEVFTGFTPDGQVSQIDELTGLPRAVAKLVGNRATRHNNNTKLFSNRINNGQVTPDEALTNGNSATEASAIDEIDQIVELVFQAEEPSKYICRKLYRYFIHNDVNVAVEESIVNEMAQSLRDNNYKIQVVLTQLLTSEYFYQESLKGGMIKSPLTMIVGTLKTIEHQIPNIQTNSEAYLSFFQHMVFQLSNIGLDVYDPFEVAGYSAYHQYPNFSRNWITTTSFTNRYNFIKSLISNKSFGEGLFDVIQFVKTYFDAEASTSARALVVALVSLFCPRSSSISFDENADAEITPERLNYHLDTFLGDIDADPEGEWANRWIEDIYNGEEDVVRNQLENLFNSIMQSPEYQLY